MFANLSVHVGHGEPAPGDGGKDNRPMNAINTDPENLNRRCWINAALIRHDALDCTFQTNSWRAFFERVASTANGPWGSDAGGPPVSPFRVRLAIAGRRATWVSVADLAAASAACREFIVKYDLGASVWRGGDVVDSATEKPVAKVSYNGRVLPAHGVTPESA
jgi:hypothetical protein